MSTKVNLVQTGRRGLAVGLGLTLIAVAAGAGVLTVLILTTIHPITAAVFLLVVAYAAYMLLLFLLSLLIRTLGIPVVGIFLGGRALYRRAKR